jgi:hypothetical protein
LRNQHPVLLVEQYTGRHIYGGQKSIIHQ